MKYTYMIIFPFISLVVLFFLTRLIGYRQMSQLSLFDYINGITIGSIASEVAISRKDEIIGPLIALIIFGLITFISAFISDKSVNARRKITGTPIPLILKGKMYDKNFNKAHLDLSEFTMQARNQGYFDVSQIDSAILEPNGIISILPKSQDRPVTPGDMNFVIPQESILANIIMDSKIVLENLKNMGFDKKWLDKKLYEDKVELKDVFLATISPDGQITWYMRQGVNNKDILA